MFSPCHAADMYYDTETFQAKAMVWNNRKPLLRHTMYSHPSHQHLTLEGKGKSLVGFMTKWHIIDATNCACKIVILLYSPSL